MRVGISTWWFNRGQATVGRYLRATLDELGHETFVLARPSPPKFFRPSFVDQGDVWAQEGVTTASATPVPRDELLAWAATNRLDAVFFFQKYEFDDVAALRRQGITILGCFMWETFSEADVEPANRAYDLVYSLNRCSHERYIGWGLRSSLLGWGCHPETLAHRRSPDPSGPITFIFPGGYLSLRKPVRATLEAFAAVGDSDARLIVKAQGHLYRREHFDDLLERDPRVELHMDDLSCAEYLALMSSSDVLLAPSRWEGLGLHLFEALAFGLPAIVSGVPPMDEVLGDAGRYVRCVRDGATTSGLPSYEPDVDDLARAIEELLAPDRRKILAAAMRRRADELSWSHFRERLAAVLDEAVRSHADER